MDRAEAIVALLADLYAQVSEERSRAERAESRVAELELLADAVHVDE